MRSKPADRSVAFRCRLSPRRDQRLPFLPPRPALPWWSSAGRERPCWHGRWRQWRRPSPRRTPALSAAATPPRAARCHAPTKREDISICDLAHSDRLGQPPPCGGKIVQAHEFLVQVILGKLISRLTVATATSLWFNLCATPRFGRGKQFIDRLTRLGCHAGSTGRDQSLPFGASEPRSCHADHLPSLKRPSPPLSPRRNPLLERRNETPDRSSPWLAQP